MPQWEITERGIESSGACIQSMINGFGPFKSSISRLLLDEGVGRKGKDGLVELDFGAWYPIEAELRALRRTASAVGEATLFSVGMRIPEFTEFPPSVVDIHSAMQSLDIGYHLNHRKNGKVMFDVATGNMLEGIGHFTYEVAPTERKITVSAPGPFPCDFNRGIVTGLALKYERSARVIIDESKPQLKRGAESSTYVITW